MVSLVWQSYGGITPHVVVSYVQLHATPHEWGEVLLVLLVRELR
eukprot:CAMPEP_0206232624 /NCGR_PEP_ID=MMETSP0047_2-20121206/11520_1 /ASSEMBLY_ACC=CAM_ASM_000192 /TAXON_ID=195065 /ORGANISM="Chroomonas mesostigmatica_cf, Strain CCMP1168" /LENGTH=43 /DNA_ID= /DNA_START= /DNA_END= /DNA_ORIENTATION=